MSAFATPAAWFFRMGLPATGAAKRGGIDGCCCAI
jgi:hypothetical protein